MTDLSTSSERVTPETGSEREQGLRAARPFRDLCPEADLRDAMSEDDFWAHVFRQDEPDIDGPDLDATTNQDRPCPLCGEFGACGYDPEGRPLIHSIQEEE